MTDGGKQRINVALIGAGYIGHYHARGLREQEGVDIKVVCDVKEDIAGEFAKQHEIPEVCTAALQLASLRGVDVRILIPDKADHLGVWLAAYSYLDEFSSTGVDFYRYQDGFLHQKVMLIDGEAATVGTANFDNRSFRLNFELSVLVADHAFAVNVEKMLVDDFANCQPVTREETISQSFPARIAIAGSRLLSPIL